MSRLTSHRSGVTYVLNSDTVGRATAHSVGTSSGNRAGSPVRSAIGVSLTRTTLGPLTVTRSCVACMSRARSSGVASPQVAAIPSMKTTASAGSTEAGWALVALTTALFVW